MIVKGIEAAQKDLAIEKEKNVTRRGRHQYSHDVINNYCCDVTFVLLQSVLKNIPVVGSLFGWFVSSPTSGSKGRTFSLQSGKFYTR